MNIRVTSSEFNPFDYWSNTYDVLVIRGEEDDARIVVIAQCESREAAEAVSKSDLGRDYFACIRPPRNVVTEGVRWMNDAMNARLGYLKIEHN